MSPLPAANLKHLPQTLVDFDDVASPGMFRLPHLLRLRRQRPRVVEPTGAALVDAMSAALSDATLTADHAAVAAFTNYAADRGSRLVAAACVVCGDERPEFAVVATVAPGRTAMINAGPGLTNDADTQTAAAACVARCCSASRDAGATMAQMLLRPDAAHLATFLTQRCGFGHLAELAYFHHTGTCREPHPLPPGYTTLTYEPGRRGLFERAIGRTYEGTLDCPELSHVRSLSDTLDGHAAAGVFAAEDWHVVIDASGEPAAVLLLAGMGVDGSDGVEVVYLGVAAPHRGRGLARHLVHRALRRCASTRGRLTALGVDTRNTPALSLYVGCGFREVERRVVLLRHLTHDVALSESC